MSENTNASTPDYRKQAAKAWQVGIGLMLASGLSLGLWSIFPGTHSHIFWCLVVATIQVSIQLLLMMHLKDERGIIFKFLVFTLFFVMALFVLTGLARSSPLHDATFSSSK